MTAGHAVVTGATSGIGRWIARGLAEAGFSLSLIARDTARAATTRDWLLAEIPEAEIDWFTADLSLLAETRAAAAAIAAAHPAIGLLVANAGLLVPVREMTAEGHETILATNLLSPLALTEALLPALAAAAPSRVVMTGSSSSDRAALDPADLDLTQGWRMSRAYARSKLALLMMSRAWSSRLAARGVTINVVHPGLVATRIVRHGGIDEWVWRLMRPAMLSPEDGAITPLHACLSPEMAGRTGLYLKRKRVARPNRRVFDADLAARLEAAVTARLG